MWISVDWEGEVFRCTALVCHSVAGDFTDLELWRAAEVLRVAVVGDARDPLHHEQGGFLISKMHACFRDGQSMGPCSMAVWAEQHFMAIFTGSSHR